MNFSNINKASFELGRVVTPSSSPRRSHPQREPCFRYLDQQLHNWEQYTNHRKRQVCISAKYSRLKVFSEFGVSLKCCQFFSPWQYLVKHCCSPNFRRMVTFPPLTFPPLPLLAYTHRTLFLHAVSGVHTTRLLVQWNWFGPLFVPISR